MARSLVDLDINLRQVLCGMIGWV